MAVAVKKVMSLKLMIDTENQRVVYAESGKQFVDFLFKILALSVGTFIPLLNQEMVGVLGNIYDSIQNLSTPFLQPDVKDTLLTPKVYIADGTGVPLLQLPNVISSKSRKLYGCDFCGAYMSDDPNTFCLCSTYAKTNRELRYNGQPSANNPFFSSETDVGEYVGEAVTYVVMDDLSVKPLSTVSVISLLGNFNGKEIGTLEEKVVDLSMDEVC